MPTSVQDFESIFPSLVEDITKQCQEYGLPTNALKWYQKSLYHNALGGKLNRGLSVPDTTSLLLARTLDTSSSDFINTATLGWMVELLQAFFLVSDDIMDASITRRGQPCWYRMPASAVWDSSSSTFSSSCINGESRPAAVGMVAINDSFMLESAIFILLKKHFRQHPSYLDLMELFHDVTFQTELGQSCDLLTAPEDHVDLTNFSMEKYNFIVKYKTAFYSFYLPVALALHYCQLATPKNLQQARSILIPMGEYFQAQDDYLDAFADAETLGKIGTDIQDNKCSWLINQALKAASPGQRTVLEQNYGRKDNACEIKVKEVYKEMHLDDVYHQYEDSCVTEIRSMIEQVDESEGLKKEVFDVFLKKIYKRNK